MTTSTFIFVRHGESEGVHEYLAGRTSGRGLTPAGRDQIRITAQYLTRFNVDTIVSSPQQRARETSDILSASLHAPVRIHTAFDELDFGEWSGAKFADLDALADWKAFNSLRSLSRPPGGESLQNAQMRTIKEVLDLHASSAGFIFAIVTHADIIRAAISYFSGAPLDLFLRFTIDPASISVVQFSDAAVQIVCVNRTP